MKKKMILNTATSLLLQLVTFFCGLILPRMILGQYGSEVNGLVQSVTQFLGVISLMELGIGQVIQSALYKPLATGQWENANAIITSGEKFFRNIAKLLLLYVALLLWIYPTTAGDQYDWMFTAALIAAMSVQSFAQYYFGIIDRILLNADQRGYIHYISQILALLVNTVTCVVLIQTGASIQMVKLASSAVFLIRPMVVRFYINRRYPVNRKVSYTGEPIQQKWNGIAQHFAAFVLDGTDNIVLTLFSSLSNVSIYSVYHMVMYGIRQIYQSAVAGIQSAVGRLWATGDMEQLKKVFGFVETGLHFATVFLFSCTGILVLPFIRVYTEGVTDVEYVQPLFSLLLVLANGAACLKTPYNIMILGAGHYKQTQRCHIIGAGMNAVISVLAVYSLGLVGVAIGTLAAMLYQAFWMANYVSRNLLRRPLREALWHFVTDAITAALIWAATSWIRLGEISYFAWFLMAIQVAAIALVVIVVAALVFYPQQLREWKDLRKK